MARDWGYKLEEWRALPDADRDLMLAEYDLVCTRCGNLRSVCSDPSIDWHPQESVCWATASQEWGVRRLAKKHEKTEVGDDELHPLDGVSVWVSQFDLEGESVAADAAAAEGLPEQASN